MMGSGNNSTMLLNAGNIRPFSMKSEVKTMMLIGYSLLFVTGCLGNTIVIFVTLYRNKKKLVTYNLLIISLAIADLLGSFFAPVIMISHLLSFSWRPLGSAGCKVFTSMTLLGSLASAWTIVVIALSRLCIMKKSSLKRKRCTKTTLIGIALAWSISCAVTSPYTFSMQIHNGKCYVDWSYEAKFICSVMFFTFISIIPITILSWAHLISIKNFRQSSTEARKNFGFQRKRQVQKITKLFSMITTTFFVLTTPYACFYMVIAYNKIAGVQIANPQLYIYLYHGLYLFSCLNFIVNPYFYARNIKITAIFKRAIGKVLYNDKNRRTRSLIRHVVMRNGVFCGSADL